MQTLPKNYDAWKTTPPKEKEPYIICEDFVGEPIWSDEDNEYFKTDEGYVLIEDKKSYLFDFMDGIYSILTTNDIERLESFGV
ncbi:hypothetical protein [Ignavigranum ruoffiae]|uniref:hypothetical protein n=1 Tax=Ignavigranum ruoffiae TaxID=89093 RepID=UPI0023578F93|nr:hypothetical protein [Ignavigranum ruoffiae]